MLNEKLDNDVPYYVDVNKHILNVVFSLNRACNLRCNHCCLNNDYKSDESFMSLENLENYFSLIEGFLKDNGNTLEDITFIISGAEISLLSDDIFIDYTKRIYEFCKEMIIKIPKMNFHVIALSNMVNMSEIKMNYLKDTYVKSLEDVIAFSVATSFERYTNRFPKKALLNKWEASVLWFRSYNIPVTVLWSISKKDALDFKDIIAYFESLDVVIHYLPLLPTGEAKNNLDLMPNYDEFNEFLFNLYNYDYKKPILSQAKFYNFDRVINMVLEQNGFVMLDLLQDLTWQFEKHNNYNIKNLYIHDQNNFIFKISDDKESSVKKITELWNMYLFQEKKFYIQAGCFTCEFFELCNGGISTFRPIHNKVGDCAGFKPFLKLMVKNEI